MMSMHKIFAGVVTLYENKTKVLTFQPSDKKFNNEKLFKSFFNITILFGHIEGTSFFLTESNFSPDS